jgi:PleD family two-component response regulator
VSNPLSLLQIIRMYAERFLGEMSSRPLRILVVDDEEPVRRYLNCVMREAGHETALASDGPEAIEVARRFQPLDLLSPTCSCRRCRATSSYGGCARWSQV